jgi:hypothetical protein
MKARYKIAEREKVHKTTHIPETGMSLFCYKMKINVVCSSEMWYDI